MPKTYVTLFSSGVAEEVPGGATWRAALNTNVSVNVSGGNAQLRLRIGFNVVNKPGSSGYIWLYDKNSTGFAVISASSPSVRTFNSTHFADGDDVPTRFALGTYLSDNNAAEESTGVFTTGSAPQPGDHVETEIAIELVAADLANNDSIGFILVAQNPVLTTFDYYSQIPFITIIK